LIWKFQEIKAYKDLIDLVNTDLLRLLNFERGVILAYDSNFDNLKVLNYD